MTLLEVTGLRKHYGATVALAGASLRCEEATVHGVVGENGAGKSTLIKIIAGLVKPDRGRVTLGGRDITGLNAEATLKAGVAVAHQELTLIPGLTVAENLLGGRYGDPRLRWGPWLRPSALFRHATERLEAVGVDWLAPTRLVQELDLPSQQSLEIAKALLRKPRLLALDEPTSALTGSQVDWLMAQIETARVGGTTVIYISHRLDEVRAVCSRASVFRDGRDVAVVDPKTGSKDEMFTLIAGRRRALDRPEADGANATDHTTPIAGGEPLLEARDLVTTFGPSPVTMEVRPGEVVGVAGLQGQGQREFFLTVYGVERARGGDIHVGGRKVRIRHPRDAIRSGIGLSLVPEDRKTEGVVLDLGVPTNLVLPVLGDVGRAGFITGRREARVAREVAGRINLDRSALAKRVGELSGGNQQKVALGKWLLADTRVLLLYDPTRGVDVGTKEEIFALVRAFAAGGGAVLFYSTTLEELLTLPDRVEVFYRGTVIDSVPREELEGPRLVSAMLGRGRELAS